MKVAIIPARGGSKRIPRKNIKEFAGKPMISFAINAAIRSGLFDKVIVTTDDDEIAKIGRDCGAEVPFERPSELSDDHTPTVPVIRHAILECEGLGWEIEAACCIYPCVPFIQDEDIQAAWKLLSDTDTVGAYAFPVAEFAAPIQRALRIDTKGSVGPMQPENELVRTQDLEPAYYDVGQFYWGWRDSWFNVDRIHSDAVVYTLPAWRVVDIDNPSDWERAEKLYKSLF